MSDSRRIYVDVDDVLAQTGRMFLGVLAREFGRSVAFEQIHSYHLGDSFESGARRARTSSCAWPTSPRPWRRSSRCPAPPRRWPAGGGRGYEIFVVTGRPPVTREMHPRLARSPRHGVHRVPLPGQVLEVLQRPAGADAGDALPWRICPGSSFTLAVEDFPGTVEHLAGTLGVPVALFDRPWNRKVAEPVGDGGAPIVRCRDWAEIRRCFPSP